MESIKIWCGRFSLINDRELLKVIATDSPKNFYELEIANYSSTFSPAEDLESFFIRWKKRRPSRSLNLIISVSELDESHMKMIQKYKNLDVIKKFEIKEIINLICFIIIRA